ncbi:MAG: UDP-N-acetylmuramate:L-alanyl-gamma-D-glutamyl-meso-diaminopimelate ligase [Betaproteobacteria bacterium TMED156]|nr:MAG: UDP-N-acetylmuramate:L-alanyl-gamma-D-glutamyl-meso-diaminopimelate ligase [Betaproteobacteria bacterium TMED156]
MHIHIIGICGTFMGSLALLARNLGMKVTGCDSNVYPPMSDQLKDVGIKIVEGYDHEQIKMKPDLWVIGNVATREFPIIELILNQKSPFISGPAFLKEFILKNKHVIAVAGTHGKTTTSALIAWILEYTGNNPGFLIGGVPNNFNLSAKLGEKNGIFVLEADEYDTAFFDKRSKFLHYTPKIAVLNNLEFDHADIFRDLKAVEDQFHYWMKIIPSKSQIIINKNDMNLTRLIERGVWSKTTFFNDSDNWFFKTNNNKTNNFGGMREKFYILNSKKEEVEFSTSLLGEHNKSNILAAVATVGCLGISIKVAAKAINTFVGIKKRLELKGEVNEIKVFDDFAHHPTAIKLTIQAVRKNFIENSKNHKNSTTGKILVAFEPRSNSMKMGAMKKDLAQAFSEADELFVFCKKVNWDLNSIFSRSNLNPKSFKNLNDLIESIVKISRRGDIILVMSNGSFGGIHKKILEKLKVNQK